MKNKNYIILEVIPSAINPEYGEIIQLSALKLNDLILKDRFDYRLNPKKIKNEDLKKMINYDNNLFKYVDDSKIIMNDFKKWIGDYKLLIIDNVYTKNYIKEIKNPKESIFKFLNLTFSDDIIDIIIEKYKLQPSNYIVDLLYEALIFESENK